MAVQVSWFEAETEENPYGDSKAQSFGRLKEANRFVSNLKETPGVSSVEMMNRAETASGMVRAERWVRADTGTWHLKDRETWI